MSASSQNHSIDIITVVRYLPLLSYQYDNYLIKRYQRYRIKYPERGMFLQVSI